MNILNKAEASVIQMALSMMIEDLEAVGSNQNFPFTPEARKDQKEILSCAKSALQKIAKAQGELIQLDPYQEGDEKEFLTKQS